MQRAAIEQLLPAVFQLAATPGSPTMAVLDAMEALHEPDEVVLSEIDRYFDPYRAPERFVPFLARWVDLGWLLALEGGRPYGTVPYPAGATALRNLVALGASLAQQRGTPVGLCRFLDTATGVPGFAVDDALPDRPFHVRVTAPAAARPLADLIHRVVDAEKPASTTYELTFDDDADDGRSDGGEADDS